MDAHWYPATTAQPCSSDNDHFLALDDLYAYFIEKDPVFSFELFVSPWPRVREGACLHRGGTLVVSRSSQEGCRDDGSDAGLAKVFPDQQESRITG